MNLLPPPTPPQHKKNHKAPRGSLTEPMMNDLEENTDSQAKKISAFLEASARVDNLENGAPISVPLPTKQSILLEKSIPLISSQAEEEESGSLPLLDPSEPSSFLNMEIIGTVLLYLLIEVIVSLDLHLRLFSISPHLLAYLPSFLQMLLKAKHIFSYFTVTIYLYCMNMVFVWLQRLRHDSMEKVIVHYRFFRCITGISVSVFAATLYMTEPHDPAIVDLYMERTVQIFYCYLISEFCFYLYVRDKNDPRTIRPAMRSWVFGMVLSCLLCFTPEENVRLVGFSMAVYSCFAQISIFIMMDDENFADLTSLEEIFDASAIILALYFGGQAPNVDWIKDWVNLAF